MAPADGSYAPRSPDLSFLSSEQPPPPPLPPNMPQQPYGQHSRTPSAEHSIHHRSAPPYPPSGPGYHHHGEAPTHGFSGSPAYLYSSLPPQPPQPPAHALPPHMTSPPPPHPASGLSRYQDPSTYNLTSALPPFSPHHQPAPYYGAHNPLAHGSPTPPHHQHQYSPVPPAQHIGHSPPQQASHQPAHLQSQQPPPPAHPHTAFPDANPYSHHAPPAEPQAYYRPESQGASTSSYQAAQFSDPAAADHGLSALQHSSFTDMPPKAAAPAKEPEIMFSPVKTKFPTARIKRIMQADEEVGKVAQQTPIAVGKALELFMVQLVTKSADVARDKNSKRITAQMLKQVIDSGQEWDFLQDIVAKVTDEKEGAKGSAKAKAESETDEEIEPAEPKKRGRGTGRKKKNAD